MYDKSLEKKFYSIWKERGYFELEGNASIAKPGKHFALMMPPPNVTGVLHIGHALTFTLQDIMTRFKRMDGFITLYQPGLDHAGIATQNVVEKELLKEGITKEELGREEFIKRVWAWKEKSGGKIIEQMQALGISPAFSRLRFTMDEGLANSVKEAFVGLYEKGLIKRSNYMINWCTHDGALSDIEVEHKESKSKLYYIKYFLDEGEFVTVATTRPETYFGDTALMVNPQDERFKHLIGKFVRLPLGSRKIPIIADEHVDMSFGTGVVKVTPAHDHNDYEVGLRHDLDFITIFDEKGILNEHCLEFKGLERLEARSVVADALQKAGHMEKVEDYTNQIGLCYRCKNVVEPYISKQWFVDASIADESTRAVNEGKCSFYPPSWLNSYNAWMRELRPWCISRQLWWGHQIPIFYCDECTHEFASKDSPKACPKCGSEQIHQDPDVLDTWFSSGLWAISTLGWGNKGFGKGTLWHEEDLERFFPNSLLITGFDILFFWVARMIFQSSSYSKELPFKDIYLHALVKDEFGQKMSKSVGNVIDPLESIEEYSADILRFTLTLLCVQGRDVKLNNDKFIQVRNFTNKLVNAAKFLQLYAPVFKENLSELSPQSPLERYFLSRFNACVSEVRTHLEVYRFNDAANCIYRFLWNEFCDWGIELCKVEKSATPYLAAIFKESCKLLHPFMPFITEYLYQDLSGSCLEENESIMVSTYPVAGVRDMAVETEFELLIEAIMSIRRAKTLIDLGNARIAKASLLVEKGDLSLHSDFIKKLAKCDEIEFVSTSLNDCVKDISKNLTSFISIKNIDLAPILKRLGAQEIKLLKEKEKLEKMLGNDSFLARAPKELVQANKEALASLNERLAKIQSELALLKG